MKTINGDIRERARAIPANEEDQELLRLRGGAPSNGVFLDIPGNLIVLDFAVRHAERVRAREITRRR